MLIPSFCVRADQLVKCPSNLHFHSFMILQVPDFIKWQGSHFFTNFACGEKTGRDDSTSKQSQAALIRYCTHHSMHVLQVWQGEANLAQSSSLTPSFQSEVCTPQSHHLMPVQWPTQTELIHFQLDSYPFKKPPLHLALINTLISSLSRGHEN